MNPTLLTDPSHDARAFVRRYIFGTSAVLSGIGGLLMAMMDGSGVNHAREFESMTLLAREVMPAVRSALAR